LADSDSINVRDVDITRSGIKVSVDRSGAAQLISVDSSETRNGNSPSVRVDSRESSSRRAGVNKVVFNTTENNLRNAIVHIDRELG
jgi:hypothetical protein